jgi:hypothetical protein
MPNMREYLISEISDLVLLSLRQRENKAHQAYFLALIPRIEISLQSLERYMVGPTRKKNWTLGYLLGLLCWSFQESQDVEKRH